ncbi:MAG: twin-arginine translocation signal domain-containing protein [Cytophagaceae bacterium]|nr:MAG: twin-arginine translocation signal domain-containing protein [Cytophagaceae bacterium]
MTLHASLTRRHFLRNLGISAAALPFLAGLPDLTGATLPQRRQRLIIMFSPNGTLPKHFWPDQEGESFEFKQQDFASKSPSSFWHILPAVAR